MCSASADVEQPPRPWRRRLRLKSDSSCRGVPRPLRLPNPSGGATTGHMDFCRFSRAGPSDSPLAGRSSKDGISLRKKRRCPVPVARSTPDEDQAHHGSRKAGAAIPTVSTLATTSARCRNVPASPTNSRNSAEFERTHPAHLRYRLVDRPAASHWSLVLGLGSWAV